MSDINSFFPGSSAELMVQGDTLYVCDSFSRKLLAFPLRGEAS